MGALPFAVHIADGVLRADWLGAGFVGMALIMASACIRIRDEEIPRIALLTSAFFVASLLHLRLGPTSVHLLLNGLVGVVLGVRAGLAIPLGLLLQAVFLGHGGFTSLGVNACVMGVPALIVGGLFRILMQATWSRSAWFRALLVSSSTALLLPSLVFSLSLLLSDRTIHSTSLERATKLALHPITLAITCVLAALTAWWEQRSGHLPEFAIGLTLGIVAVLATIALNSLVLILGGAERFDAIALFTFIAHIPLALLEGVVLGSTLAYLARVKPEMIGAGVVRG